jgi:hypothetical protein
MTPDEIIEVVARAMARADCLARHHGTFPEIDEFVDIEWPGHETTARAAILTTLRAIREPTQSQLDAARPKLHDSHIYTAAIDQRIKEFGRAEALDDLAQLDADLI